jgi:hypothetical protein
MPIITTTFKIAAMILDRACSRQGFSSLHNASLALSISVVATPLV